MHIPVKESAGNNKLKIRFILVIAAGIVPFILVLVKMKQIRTKYIELRKRPTGYFGAKYFVKGHLKAIRQIVSKHFHM